MKITKLPNECVQNPTPLLKLLFVWSKQPTYVINLIPAHIHYHLFVHRLHHLFQQTPQRREDVVILGQVFACLLTKGISKSVTSVVMEMAYTFLGDEGASIGLILPHSKLILDYLNIALKGSVKGCSLELAVLSRSVNVKK